MLPKPLMLITAHHHYLQYLTDYLEECFLEEMFILSTTPSGTHKNYTDYSQFWIRRYIIPLYKQEANTVHVIFDNPGRLRQTPKQYERERHDNSTSITSIACAEMRHSTKLIRTLMGNWHRAFGNQGIPRKVEAYTRQEATQQTTYNLPSFHSVTNSPRICRRNVR